MGHVATELAQPSFLARRNSNLKGLKLTVPRPLVKLDSSDEEDFNKSYDMLEVLGNGSTATVRLAKKVSDGQLVALKKTNSRERLAIATHEHEVLKRLNHPNIVKVFDFQVIRGQATMVMEYFNGTTLGEVVRGPSGCLSEGVAQVLAYQLFDAVKYLHDRDIIHRDLKPENMLVSTDLSEMKLLDFNVSARARKDDEPLTPAGTLMYAAPEVIQNEPSSKASDVWGAALCVFYMMSGRLPQARDRTSICRAELERVAEREVTFTKACWASVSTPAKEFLSSCLAVSEERRLLAKDALKNTWLAAGQQ